MFDPLERNKDALQALEGMIKSERMRQQREREKALIGDNSLAPALQELLDDLGISPPVHRNLVQLDTFIFRAARPAPDAAPQLQLFGKRPGTDEDVWSAHFTTIEELVRLLDDFKPAPEYISAAPQTAVEQLEEAIRRVVREEMAALD